MSHNPESGKNPIALQAQREVKRRTDELSRIWKNAGEMQDIRAISEAIFIRDFLPFFSGQTKPEEEERNFLMACWLRFAGTPFTPVDLHNQFGQIVYRVPPVQDRTALITSVGNRLNKAARAADQKALMSPKFGEQIMQNEYTDRTSRFLKKTSNPELIKAWKDLFVHYGVADAADGEVKRTDDTSSDFIMD